MKNRKPLTFLILSVVMAMTMAVPGDAQYNAKVYHKQGGDEFVVASGGTLTVESGGIMSLAPGAVALSAGSMTYNIRSRFTVAQVNAGATVLSAVSGKKYRMVECKAISVGGAAGAVTTVDILATQAAGSVKLVAYAQASLTQSTVLTDGGSGAAVLADGASYVQNDTNTAITINKTGASVTTATHIDVILTYAVES